MEDHKSWMMDLFRTGKYSDIDLISNNKSYKAHRSVVCSMSPVIDRFCEFNTAKLDRVESEPNKSDRSTTKASFNFGDDDPEAVDCLVQFFYLWDYEVASPLSGSDLDRSELREDIYYSPVPEYDVFGLEARQLLLHSKVFTLAHTYNVPRLKELCIKKLREVASRQWRSDYLLDVAREAYAATPSDVLEMRKAIVQIFAEHRELLDENRVREFLLETPHLTLDIMLYINKPPSSLGSSGRGFFEH